VRKEGVRCEEDGEDEDEGDDRKEGMEVGEARRFSLTGIVGCESRHGVMTSFSTFENCFYAV